MKKSIVIIFILMSVCVAGITALQLYYSYTNYVFAERVFKKDANEALVEASDSVRIIHHNDVKDKFRLWMNDAAFVKISCKWKADQKVTLFTIKEVKPYRGSGQVEISLSIDKITDRLDSLTPKKKALFIEHMVSTVDDGLKRGTVWFFTQGLGDSLSKAYYKTPIDTKVVIEQYRLALGRREISMPFTFEKKPKFTDFTTHQVDMGVDTPQLVQAHFLGVDVYLFSRLKWVIIGSLALIIITLACFWYTARTLLSQHRLNIMKDDFISNMTHEIHTPLSSIIVTAEALQKFRHDEEAKQSYIEIILHQGHKLSALTEEILAGAKMEKTGISLADMIEVNNFINGIVDANHFRNVEYSGTANAVSVKVNALHLANAIANLLDNALKYNTADDPRVTIACKVSGKEISIAVADNGPGIPVDEKEKIFGQFYRIPSGDVHNIKGYGLGLSYVKKVVLAHKGTVSVTDNVPTGSIFTIKLPL